MKEADRSPDLVDESHAARILGISQGTLRYWRNVKKGPPFVRLEGRIRYDVLKLRQYIDAGRVDPSVRASIGG